MELELDKYEKEEEELNLEGGWHTEISLQAENWTEKQSCTGNPAKCPHLLAEPAEAHDLKLVQVGTGTWSDPHKRGTRSGGVEDSRQGIFQTHCDPRPVIKNAGLDGATGLSRCM